MKKFVAGICLLACSCVFAVPVFKGIVPAQEVRVRDGVGNFLEKIRAGKKEIVVAYLGGSITSMKGWRNLTTQWLQSTYPQVKFLEVHAAIGGTGSNLGVFRVQHDALQKNPDLLFVEFATNDHRNDPHSIWRSMEGIVRQTWRKDPTTDIVFTYTITKGMTDSYGQGQCTRAASSMEQLADYYGIPSICFGPRVMTEVSAGRLVMDWSEAEQVTGVRADTPKRDQVISEKLRLQGKALFARDSVHPGPPGHALYLQSIQAGFEAMKNSHAQSHASKLKGVFTEDNLESAKFVAIKPSMLKGSWENLKEKKSRFSIFLGRTDDLWHTETPGDTLTFTFKGTHCLLYDLLGPNTAQLLITVDGKPWAKPRARIDPYSTGHRLATLHLFEGADGVHTVKIEIDKTQPSRECVFQSHPEERTKADTKYNGTNYWVGQILIVGDLVE